jgi:hypothetical protein
VLIRQHHGPGRWELALRPDQDATLPDLVKVDGHLVVTQARIREPGQYSDADLLAQAHYVGVVQGWEPREDGPGWALIRGAGLASRLQDHVFKAERSYQAVGLTNLLNRSASTPYGILRGEAGGQTSIRAGTITDPGGVTFTGRFPAGMDALTALGYAAATYGQDAASAIEWLVHDNGPRATAAGTTVGYIDVRPTATLFPTAASPTVLLAERADTDATYEGIEARRVAGYSTGRILPTDLWVLGEGLTVPVVGETTIARPAEAETLGLHGETLQRILAVSEPVTSAANADTRAAYLAGFLTEPFDLYRIPLDQVQAHHLRPGALGPGDGAYLYLPSRGVEDLTRTVRVGDTDYHPRLLRVATITEPARAGFGYYYRSGAGVWTDITDQVAPEAGEGEVELVSTLRPLTAPDDAYSVQSQGNPNTTTPNPPTGITYTAGGFQHAGGQQKLAYYELSWTAPTTNTDGSTITDGKQFQIAWRRRGTGTYRRTWIPWDVTTARLEVPYADAVEVGIQLFIRAEDNGSNYSTWETPAVAARQPFAAGQTCTGGHFDNTTDPLTVATFGTTYTDLAAIRAGAYLLLDSEVIGCSARSGASATFTRGALSTTPAAHPNGTIIYTATPVDTTAPDTPPQPTLTLIGSSVVRVTIDTSTGNWGQGNPDVWALAIYGGPANPPAGPPLRRIGVHYEDLVTQETFTRDIRVRQSQCGAPWYVGVKAVDCRGNLSAMSTVSTVTPQLVETGDVKDAAVTGPKLGDGDVVALLTLASTGKIRTASSGQRLELVATSSDDMLLLYSGVSGETAGRLWPYAIGSTRPTTRLTAPYQASGSWDTQAILELSSGLAADTSENAPWAKVTGNVVPSADATYALGNTDADTGVPTGWKYLWAGTHYCDRGDGTYAESAPYGTLIPDGTGTHTTVGSSTLNGGSMAEIATVDITLEYSGQQVIVEMFVSARVSGLTAGEWWALRPYVQGIARGNSALTDIPASGAFTYSFLGQAWVGTVTVTGTPPALTLSIQAQTQTSDATVDQVLIAYAVYRA